MRVLESIDRHFAPHKSMLTRAPADVEELERIIILESQKSVAWLDRLTSEPQSAGGGS